MSHQPDFSEVIETARTRIDRLKTPAYTGSNRCFACTIINIALVAVLAVVGSAVRPPLGVAVGIGGLCAVFFRGYLIPGTPALTKRYAPRWLLEWVGQPPSAPQSTAASASAVGQPTREVAEEAATDAEQPPVDVERILTETGAVADCEATDDLRLTDAFAREWRRSMSRIRDGETSKTVALASLVDVHPKGVTFSTADDGTRIFASADDAFVGQWVSEAALVADVAGASVLEETGVWERLGARERGTVLGALRVFLPVCPSCNGSVEIQEDVTGGCCWSTPVVVLRCTDCSVPLLRLDQSAVAVNGDTRV